jgi:hypothetical protein
MRNLCLVLIPALLLSANVFAASSMTAIIDIDGRSSSIPVDDLASCQRAVTNRINNLAGLYQNSLTVTNVVAQCMQSDGQLAAFGRCGVKGIGQVTKLCVPDLRTP